MVTLSEGRGGHADLKKAKWSKLEGHGTVRVTALEEGGLQDAVNLVK